MASFPNIIRMPSTTRDDIRLPEDEDIEYLDFYIPESTLKINVKKLISPYQDDAFSEEVLHDVVNERLGFSLSFEMWEHINDAFSYYWDEEVGLGGCLYEGEMFSSIQQYLIDNQVLCPYYLLKEIVDAIEDFISSIPGVYID